MSQDGNKASTQKAAGSGVVHPVPTPASASLNLTNAGTQKDTPKAGAVS